MVIRVLQFLGFFQCLCDLQVHLWVATAWRCSQLVYTSKTLVKTELLTNWQKSNFEKFSIFRFHKIREWSWRFGAVLTFAQGTKIYHRAKYLPSHLKSWLIFPEKVWMRACLDVRRATRWSDENFKIAHHKHSLVYWWTIYARMCADGPIFSFNIFNLTIYDHIHFDFYKFAP